MKTILFKLIVFLVIFLSSVNLIAQIGFTITFEQENLKVERMNKYGEEYLKLSYPDCRSDGEEGTPALPYKYVQVIVPDNNASYKVEIDYAEQEDFFLTYKILPIQPPAIPSIYSTQRAFVYPDYNIYESLEVYPSDIVSIVQDGYFDGDKRILTLKVYTMQYVALQRRGIWNNRLNILLTPYKRRTAAESQIQPIHCSVVKSEEILTEELSFVENKVNLPLCIQQFVNQSSILASTASMPEYLIVTSEMYVPTLEKLAFWKRLKGLTSGIVTMENILKDTSIRGDEVSGIYDDAGKLRQYLRNAYVNGTKYVFLVGKDVPFRYGTGRNNIWQEGNTDYKIPSDLYFSDLNGNWNVDKDQYYGEPTEDAVDYSPELYVGRLLCKNVEELKNYLHKLFCYEKNPGNGDALYLKKALYTQSDNSQDGKFANIFSGKLTTIFTTNIIREELPGLASKEPYAYKGNQIIKDINERYGLINFNNHGWDCGIRTLTKGLNEAGLSGIAYCDAYDEEIKNSIAEVYESGNGVDCLTNTYYPLIVYSTSCGTMPYDKLSNIPYNFGEAFTVMGKYGAVAYLGNTRNGYGNGFSEFFANCLNTPIYSLGKAEALSKQSVKDHFNALSHNMLGCPQTPIWKYIPASPFSPIVFYEGSQLRVRSSSTAPPSVSLIGLFNGKTYLQTKSSGPGQLNIKFDNIPKNFIITTHRIDYLPYINENLRLQNEEVTGKESIFFVKNIYIGSNVSEAKSAGNFILKSGADVSIEYSGEVILDTGFEVEKGASLMLNPAKE